MKKILALLLAATVFTGSVMAQQPQTAPAPKTTTKPAPEKKAPPAEKKADGSVAGASVQDSGSAAKHTKKDGTPDKRYKENQKVKKDGTPDMRYKENKPSTAPSPAK